MVSFTKSSSQCLAVEIQRGGGGEEEKKLPREQQLNENSSLELKCVQSSRNCLNKGAVVSFQQSRCYTVASTSAQLDPDLHKKPPFV